MFERLRQSRDRKSDRKRIRRIVWDFWEVNHITELCEKWVFCDGNYACTRFEELRTRSGEVLFTREYKATASEDKSDTYIDIDELKMFKNFSNRGKTKIKTKDMIDKINNKISTINETTEGLANIKADLPKKLNLIYEVILELQDEIHSNDSWLRLVELDKIDVILEEAFNIVWERLYENKN